MQSTSQDLEAKQDLKSKIDLSEIAAQHPVNLQVAVLNLNTFDATQLTLLEVLDMSETVGIAPEMLATLLSGKSTIKRMRMLYALAWCIARRANPALTYDEVCTWKLEVVGEVDKEKQALNASRAATLVGAAAMTGLTPEQAGNLTVAEISAYKDRQLKVNRAARRRKAG